MSTHLTIDLNLNILAAYLVYSCIFQQDDQLSLSLFTRYILHIYVYLYGMVWSAIFQYVALIYVTDPELVCPSIFKWVVSSGQTVKSSRVDTAEGKDLDP